MKTKICSNCDCWIYTYPVAGVCYGICENVDSELNGETTQEGTTCPEFEEDDGYEDREFLNDEGY